MFHIMIAEDDVHIRRLMAAYLTKDGYLVLEAGDGKEALDLMDSSHVDLLITDIMMPGMDGFSLASSLREAGYELPILMITAKETYGDKKEGFSSGADDYMVKPVDMDEMLLRVAALLRRAKIAADRELTVGGAVLSYDGLTVTSEGEVIALPKKEFYLLYKLLSQPKRIFTRRQLMDEIWGMDAESDERTVDVHVKRLREKLGHIGDFEIITVRGLGYKVEKKV